MDIIYDPIPSEAYTVSLNNICSKVCKTPDPYMLWTIDLLEMNEMNENRFLCFKVNEFSQGYNLSFLKRGKKG